MLNGTPRSHTKRDRVPLYIKT